MTGFFCDGYPATALDAHALARVASLLDAGCRARGLGAGGYEGVCGAIAVKGGMADSDGGKGNAVECFVYGIADTGLPERETDFFRADTDFRYASP